MTSRLTSVIASATFGLLFTIAIPPAAARVMPTYFPGVIKGTEARRVTLTVGQEAAATDFSLVPGRAAKVTGQALDSQGRPFADGGSERSR